MGDLPKLTIEERILLVLVDHLRFRDSFEVPAVISQDGLAALIGAIRPNISRSLGSLKEKGLVRERLAHVTGQRRRKKVYELADGAVEEALKARDGLGSLMVGGETIARIAKRTSRDISAVYLSLIRGERPTDEAVRPVADGKRPFFGRAKEIGLVRSFISDPAKRVLVVHGIAGIGKTSLLERSASTLKEPFLWVRIPETSSLEGVLHQIEVAVSDPALGRHRSSRETASAIARAIQGRGVLVLDDLHHADRRFLEVMTAMISVEGDPKIICTSRVRGLFYSPRDSMDRLAEIDLKGLEKADALGMLEARKITGESAENIWQRFGGHPIALMLASGSESVEPASDVSIFIQMDILSRLPADEMMLLKALSVFRRRLPDPFVLIRAIGSSGSILDGLINRGLVGSHPDGIGVHSLIGSVAQDRMNSEEWRKYNSHAADIYMRDRDDLVSFVESMHHLIRSGRTQEMMDGLREKGPEALGEGFMELLLILEEVDMSSMDVVSRAWVHAIKGDGESLLGNREKARMELEAAMGADHGDQSLEAFTLERMGNLLRLSGDLKGALSCLERGSARYDSLDRPGSRDRGRAISCINAIGLVRSSMGDIEGALKAFEEASALASSSDPDGSRPAIHLNIGRAHLARWDPQKALKALDKGLRAAREIGDDRSAAMIKGAMGEARAMMGDLSSAMLLFDEALTSANDPEDLEDMASEYMETTLTKRRRSALVERIGSFLRIRQGEDDELFSRLYSMICRTERSLGTAPNPDLHAKAGGIFQGRGMKKDATKAFNNQGISLLSSGDSKAAIGALQKALVIAEEPRARAITLFNLSRALMRAERREDSARCLTEARDLSRSNGLSDLDELLA